MNEEEMREALSHYMSEYSKLEWGWPNYASFNTNWSQKMKKKYTSYYESKD